MVRLNLGYEKGKPKPEGVVPPKNLPVPPRRSFVKKLLVVPVVFALGCKEEDHHKSKPSAARVRDLVPGDTGRCLAIPDHTSPTGVENNLVELNLDHIPPLTEEQQKYYIRKDWVFPLKLEESGDFFLIRGGYRRAIRKMYRKDQVPKAKI